MLVTFEGLDFCGKTTQVQLLESWLSTSVGGAKVKVVREPGGTRVSELIRDLLLDPYHAEIDAVAELFLFSAARAQLVRQNILPALKRGDIVICDRFADSTVAYQGYGRGIDLETIDKINTLATAGIVPDVTFLLDISPEESYRRRGAYGAIMKSDDRMEQSGIAFYARVREGYLAIARASPERVLLIDGTKPIDVIAGEIQIIIKQRGVGKNI
ncbi:MAG: dTMP kinase [Bacteroidota bacterium]